jgi:tRNA G18 (ribose-2'-O)-methylase SpoU
MIFGQEQIGIPKKLLDLCDELVYIKQYGSVRSLNVGTASGIAMYDYCSKVCNGVQIG